MAYFHYSVTGVNAPWRIFIWTQLNGTVGPSMHPQNQMSGLAVAFLQSAHGASGRMPAGQTGRQCVATHSIVGSEERLRRSFLNQTEDQMPRSKAQWSTSGEWIVSWAHSDRFLKTHKVFGLFFVVLTEKSQIMKCNEGVIVLQKDNPQTFVFIRWYFQSWATHVNNDGWIIPCTLKVLRGQNRVGWLDWNAQLQTIYHLQGWYEYKLRRTGLKKSYLCSSMWSANRQFSITKATHLCCEMLFSAGDLVNLHIHDPNPLLGLKSLPIVHQMYL